MASKQDETKVNSSGKGCARPYREGGLVGVWTPASGTCTHLQVARHALVQEQARYSRTEQPDIHGGERPGEGSQGDVCMWEVGRQL